MTAKQEYLSKHMENIHSELNRVKALTSSYDDPMVNKLYQNLEYETLRAMRRLRVYLHVPYNAGMEGKCQ